MTVQTDFSVARPTEHRLCRYVPDIAGWIARRFELARDRREVRRLLDLNDTLLNDMGLDRPDIFWALAGSPDKLPSHRLQALRAQRSRKRLAGLGVIRRR